MDRSNAPLVPLHLTSLAILTPQNHPLYIHSFTSPADELRHYHLSHAAIDVIEERIVMTSTATKPADSYLGLLFCMEDMAFYGFQTPTKMRMVLSVALVDAMIKDSDIVAIFRAVQQLLLQTINNPFLSLPPAFQATPITASTETETPTPTRNGLNNSVPISQMFATGPEDMKSDWLKNSGRFQSGITRIGELLSGVRG